MNRKSRRKIMKNLDEKDFVKIMRTKVYMELAKEIESQEEPTYLEKKIPGKGGTISSLYIVNKALIDKLIVKNDD